MVSLTETEERQDKERKELELEKKTGVVLTCLSSLSDQRI